MAVIYFELYVSRNYITEHLSCDGIVYERQFVDLNCCIRYAIPEGKPTFTTLYYERVYHTM